MAYQTAAWQEARVAAEAGIDVALAELSRNATGVSGGDWRGWKQQPTGGILGPAVSNTLTTIRALLGSEARTSEPIFLDNYKISGATGTPAEVDVQLWAVYPNATTNGPLVSHPLDGDVRPDQASLPGTRPRGWGAPSLQPAPCPATIAPARRW
jgi:hypothetical protein